jgi:hypothetical protein
MYHFCLRNLYQEVYRNSLFTYVIAPITSLLLICKELKDYFCTIYLPLLDFDMMVIVYSCAIKPVRLMESSVS